MLKLEKTDDRWYRSLYIAIDGTSTSTRVKGTSRQRLSSNDTRQNEVQIVTHRRDSSPSFKCRALCDSSHAARLWWRNVTWQYAHTRPCYFTIRLFLNRRRLRHARINFAPMTRHGFGQIGDNEESDFEENVVAKLYSNNFCIIISL